MNKTFLTGVERHLSADKIIVSKTDTKGRITYANRTFLDIAGFTEAELIGKPHNIIRHPDMPKCVFKYLWDTIDGGEEIFAYVVNRAKTGDHYWVFAHVTPTFDEAGNIRSYHSSRRAPRREAVAAIIPVYRELREIEARYGDPRDGMAAATDVFLSKYVAPSGTYEDLVFSL